jgi:hypothetical protein
MNTSQEETFVQTFIVPDKRERYLQMLANPSKRNKILGLLYHNLDTIDTRAASVANRDHNVDFIDRLLRRKGAGATCYLISPERELDQQEMPLREAIDMLITQDSVAVACCIPGRLAYYKAELKQCILEYLPTSA